MLAPKYLIVCMQKNIETRKNIEMRTIMHYFYKMLFHIND